MADTNKLIKPVYTLGVASKLSGIPAHSIRQYIDKGLILPYKTDTNRHLFSENDILRLLSIKKYIAKGLNIAGIKTLYAQVHGVLKYKCFSETCEQCISYKKTDLPCWIVKESNENDCSNKTCRECEVYLMADPLNDMRDFLYKLNKN